MPFDCLIQFSVHGDLAYLSHLDSLRLWQRLLRRAGWPLRFSEGFNVRPRMSLLLPRPVGTTSDDERLRVGLTEPPAAPAAAASDAACGPSSSAACGVAALADALAAVLPDGIALRAVRPAASKADFRVQSVEYVAALAEGRGVEPGAVAALLAADRRTVRRSDERGAQKEKDIRPFVQQLAADGRQVRMRLAVTDSGSARPAEVLVALGVAEADVAAARLHRTRTICAADGGGTGEGGTVQEKGSDTEKVSDTPTERRRNCGPCADWVSDTFSVSDPTVPPSPAPPRDRGPQE